MVRLKAMVRSIVRICRQISIPYGAIKRKAVGGIQNYIFLFQFLMVRLKEHCILFIFYYKIISIPYGAIKRQKVNKR